MFLFEQEYNKTILLRINGQPAKRMAFEEVVRAAQRIASFVKVTPIHRSTTIDQLCGRNIALKAELFQKTGSFKIRGALNAVSLETFQC